jgi:hypothetical protein
MVASPVLAQTGATLTGRITDMSGAAVPGAQVTVVEEETGARRTTAVGESGKVRSL